MLIYLLLYVFWYIVSRPLALAAIGYFDLKPSKDDLQVLMLPFIESMIAFFVIMLPFILIAGALLISIAYIANSAEVHSNYMIETFTDIGKRWRNK